MERRTCQAAWIIGALIIRHKWRLSDAGTIQAIRENPYMHMQYMLGLTEYTDKPIFREDANMQYMLGLTEYTDKPISDPSLFVTIRKRMTTEDINALTLALAKKSEAKKEKKDGDDEPDKTRHTGIKADATYADAEADCLRRLVQRALYGAMSRFPVKINGGIILEIPFRGVTFVAERREES